MGLSLFEITDEEKIELHEVIILWANEDGTVFSNKTKQLYKIFKNSEATIGDKPDNNHPLNESGYWMTVENNNPFLVDQKEISLADVIDKMATNGSAKGIFVQLYYLIEAFLHEALTPPRFLVDRHSVASKLTTERAIEKGRELALEYSKSHPETGPGFKWECETDFVNHVYTRWTHEKENSYQEHYNIFHNLILTHDSLSVTQALGLLSDLMIFDDAESIDRMEVIGCGRLGYRIGNAIVLSKNMDFDSRESPESLRDRISDIYYGGVDFEGKSYSELKKEIEKPETREVEIIHIEIGRRLYDIHQAWNSNLDHKNNVHPVTYYLEWAERKRIEIPWKNWAIKNNLWPLPTTDDTNRSKDQNQAESIKGEMETEKNTDSSSTETASDLRGVWRHNLLGVLKAFKKDKGEIPNHPYRPILDYIKEKGYLSDNECTFTRINKNATKDVDVCLWWKDGEEEQTVKKRAFTEAIKDLRKRL